MRGPDKGSYPNECEFINVVKPSLISWKRFTKPLFHVVATFEQVSADQTKIVYRMIFNSEEECNKVRGFAADKTKKTLIDSKMN